MVRAMTVTIDDPSAAPLEIRSWKQAMIRGARCRCPACGAGLMFAKFLKVSDSCPACGEELHHHQADDAPPYFTMFIVGHIVVPLVLIVEKLWHPALPIHFVVWTIVTLALSFAIMPAVKGAIVGLQWALRMHGFELPAGRKTQ
jgi:uncharacterized protein (DUF983 family)